MNRRWRLLIALWVGLGVALAPGALTGSARPNPPFQGRSHENHGQEMKREHAREKENRGKHKGWERDKRGYYRFNNDDHRVVESYFREHRDERWEHPPRGYALGYGHVIEQRYRRYCRPVPVVLMRELPPPPRGYRYFLFGGDVILVNNGYRVQDFIHIGINIGL